MSTNQTDQDDSKKRAAYPYYSLGKCLEFGRVVKEVGGNTGAVARSLVAQQLKCEDDSSAMTQLVIAAKTFGIVSGRGEFTLTETGRRYFYPTSEQDKRLAQLDFLAKPTVFGSLLNKFDGNQLPNTEMLGNLILGLGVPESWKGRVASLFISSLKDVGAIDEKGVVRFDAARHQTGKVPLSSTLGHADHIPTKPHTGKTVDSVHTPPPEREKPPAFDPPAPGTMSFPIGPDRYLTVPKDLTAEDCEIIKTMFPALEAFAKRGLPKQT